MDRRRALIVVAWVVALALSLTALVMAARSLSKPPPVPGFRCNGSTGVYVGTDGSVALNPYDPECATPGYNGG